MQDNQGLPCIPAIRHPVRGKEKDVNEAWRLVIVVLMAGMLAAGSLAVLWAALILSGRLTQQEREAYFDEYGTWPEW